MECKLIKGQHVACVRSPISEGTIILTPNAMLAEIGKVYTVRGLQISIGNLVVLQLAEIPDQQVDILHCGYVWHGTLAFLADAFKPLEKLKVEDFVTEGLEVDA